MFVRREFEDYLKCGLPEHGFLRVKYRCGPVIREQRAVATVEEYRRNLHHRFR
jgi:hypothetical protein